MNTVMNDPPPLTKPAASNGALPFNKMFIMLPVMLAARNLKNDDLNTVYMIRIAYAVVQTICLLLAIYAYITVSSMQGSTTATNMNRIIYVPAPAQVSGRKRQTARFYPVLSDPVLRRFILREIRHCGVP